MKERERISRITDAISQRGIHDLFIRWFGTNFEDAENKIIKHRIKIKKYWMAHHEMSFVDVLINMGYVDDAIPGYWHDESDENVYLVLTTRDKERI